MARREIEFQTIRSEGGLLPSDLLRRILDTKERLPGTNPEDYGLPRSERINEVITQSWNRLRKHWVEFRAATGAIPATDAATGPTNDKWSQPLLRELGFGPMPTSAGPEVGGRTYAISRFVGPVPVHLVGCAVDLDRRAAGVRGAAAINPHGLVQEFINRSPRHLWGIVSNGLRLRVLRDNQALSRQSFLEFDVEAMFAGEVYSDFVLLWLTTHATRFAPRESERPETCWLEEWTKEADKRGARVLGDLRGGVEKALQILGEGLTSHASNTRLREALRSGELLLADFHGQLLRVIYRLIFLFVAEDRRLDGQPLLHPRDDSDAARAARERFATYYGTGRLRDMAGKIKGSRHGDLWRQFQLLVGALSGDEAFAGARESLALPALGSFLWNPGSTTGLNDAELTNYDLLEALRHLAFTRPDKVLRPVNYRNLGAEELGGIYESLLALTPQISADGARFSFAEFAGNERKTSGSYYTPDTLVQCLLDSALDPVVEEAIKGKSGAEAEVAILALKICDPAVGSGHFLVGAAHRLARHLSRARASAKGESEPSPLSYQHALRDVIGRSLYGVDLNPMAAELCRVSLWLEALEPGRPLSFLDHHIRVGNSLLGTTPELIAGGIPDEAFTAIEGDDRKACAVLKKRNKAERIGLGPLFAEQETEIQVRLQQAAAALEELPDERPAHVQAKELAFRRREETQEYRHKKQLADAWCAAFVVRKYFQEQGRGSSASGITQGHLNDLASERSLPAALAAEMEQMAAQYQFFHWHLAFPEVFGKGGFDCVLGNPPWERVNVEARQFFASVRPEIADAITSNRRTLISELEASDPDLFHRFTKAQRQASSEISFFQNSGLYPYLNQARLNTYVVFTHVAFRVCQSTGRVGIIVPSGVATDDISRALFKFLVHEGRIERLLDFENSKGLFPGVHRSYKFCLLTLRGGRSAAPSLFAFFLHAVEDLSLAGRSWSLTSRELELLSPISGLCPTFRSADDRELVLTIYNRVQALTTQQTSGSDWRNSDFFIMFRSDDSSDIYRTIAQLGEADPTPATLPRLEHRGIIYVPVWESKLLHQFDHRFATFANVSYEERKKGTAADVDSEAKDSTWIATPRFWAPVDSVGEALESRSWKRRWTAGYRDITNATNERTSIACVLPEGGAAQPLNLFLPETPLHACVWVGVMNSFVVDYVARQRIGGVHLNITTCRQLPIVGPATLSAERNRFIRDRVLELVFTSPALEPFAQDCGWSGAHFHWDDVRRFLLRCELDAAFFHVYLPAQANGEWKRAEAEPGEDLQRLKARFSTPRDAVAYIMDTFPIVKRKDEERYGDYRTKLQILAIYDRMQEAIATNTPYQTLLDPPPADSRVAHSESTRPPAPGTAI